MVASMVMFTNSEPYVKVPSLSGVRKDVPANAASVPKTRSNSIGWPHDS